MGRDGCSRWRWIWALASLFAAACGDEPGREERSTPPADGPDLLPLGGRLAVAAPGEAELVVGPEPGKCDDLAARLEDAGEAFRPDGGAEGVTASCAAVLHRGVASRGMRLRAVLSAEADDEALTLLRFEAPELNSDLSPAAGRRFLREGEAVLEWVAPRTGELGLVVDAAAEAGEVAYALTVECLDGCDRGMTRYPIVLMHGMGGTDSFLDVLDYFNGVRGAMEAAGFDVHVTVVDPLASSRRRAEQLVPQLEAIRAATGARRLNLIGHSQGGIDGRTLIVEQDFGDRVATLTTVATPHRGTPLADIGAGVVDSSELSRDVVDQIGDVYGEILGRDDQDLPESLSELGEVYITEIFNPAHPDDPRVVYFSWSGHTCGLVDADCQRDWNGEIVTPLLSPTFRALQLLGVEANDGLVGRESAEWGEFLGELPADHLDQVGLLGLPIAFDHERFFVGEGDRLFAAGF